MVSFLPYIPGTTQLATEGQTRMFSRVRIAIRFFFVGLAVGILLAPRSGVETRRLVREKADRLLNDVLDAATLGTIDDGSASSSTTGAGKASGTDGDEAADATTPKSRNGRSRTSRAASAAQA